MKIPNDANNCATQSNSDWLFITQSRVLQADWLIILDHNEAANSYIDMAYKQKESYQYSVPSKYIKYDGKNLNAKNEFVPLHAVYMKYVQYKTSQQYMIELLFILSIVKNRVWKYHRMLPGYFLLCCVTDASYARFRHAVIHSPDF